MNKKLVLLCTVGLIVLTAGLVRAETAVTGDRAAWLLGRATGAAPGVSDWDLDQDEFGVPDMPREFEEEPTTPGPRRGSPWHLAASVVLPGSGEALMGYTRGYFMMAADIFCWVMVAKNHQDGKDLSDEYYAYADAHWTEDNLVSAYNASAADDYRRGLGLDYFAPTSESIDDARRLGEVLPLWVSKEDDRREYYENLGKWDQFVFGWDDFRRPDDPPAGIEYTPDMTLSDLRQPWTSPHRLKYREMRDAANDAYKTRDRYLYVNIGLRVFSVLQVAYLQGLFGGGDGNGLQVAGHDVQIITQPVGWHSGQLAASVSF